MTTGAGGSGVTNAMRLIRRLGAGPGPLALLSLLCLTAALLITGLLRLGAVLRR